MSGQLMGRILVNVHGIKPATKLVLIAMADPCRGESAEFFGSVAYLAARTGIGERQVREHLRELEACGLIVKMNSGKGGPRTTTRYRLIVPHDPANVRRVDALSKAANVRRVWTPDKAAVLVDKAAHVVQTTRHTSAAETLRPGTSNGSPAHALDPRTEPQAGIVKAALNRFIVQKQTPRPVGRTREEQLAWLAAQHGRAANG